jgi:DNA adenine methylase
MPPENAGEAAELLPFLKWAGGKRWLWQRHPELFEVGQRRYIEPFLGGGAIFFALNPAKAELSDLNKELIQTYTTIREDWKGVWMKLLEHQRRHLKDDDYYYLIRDSRPHGDTGRAAKFIYLNRTCFNGLYRVNLRGEFNVPKGTKDKVIFIYDSFAEVSARLRRASLGHSDFEAVIDGAGSEDFLFVDPPYTVNHNLNGFLKYNEKIFSWSDQERLAACLKRFARRGGKALVTNAAHQSVIDLYTDVGPMRAVRRHSVMASENARRNEVEEVLVMVGYSALELERASTGIVRGAKSRQMYALT